MIRHLNVRYRFACVGLVFLCLCARSEEKAAGETVFWNGLETSDVWFHRSGAWSGFHVPDAEDVAVYQIPPDDLPEAMWTVWFGNFQGETPPNAAVNTAAVVRSGSWVFCYGPYQYSLGPGSYELTRSGTSLVIGDTANVTELTLMGEDGAGDAHGSLTTNGVLMATDPANVSYVTVSGMTTDSQGRPAPLDTRWIDNHSLHIGSQGEATMVVEGGAQLTSTNPEAVSTIGQSAGSNGHLVVSGPGSLWSSAGSVVTGDQGFGYLTLLDEAHVQVLSAAKIGGQPQGFGEVNIRGAGSTWNVLDYLVVGQFGTGGLQVADGGHVFNELGGFIGQFDSAVGVVTIHGVGSQWDVGGHLYVGGAGSGTLSVTGSGHIATTGSGNIANLVGGTGNVLVSGVGTLWDMGGFLSVGERGSGTLTIADGCRVVNGLCGFVGQFHDARGAVAIRGLDSEWNVGESLIVGSHGDGTLVVEEGGHLDCPNAAWTNMIGHHSESSGHVTIRDAESSWSIAGNLLIGNGGHGSMRVERLGKVDTQSSAIVGAQPGGTGEVNVSDAGSEWGVDGFLVIGQHGGATMTIANGGYVTDGAAGFIGQFADSVGSVTVSDSGSQWDGGGHLYVGVAGEGALHVANGGRVTTAHLAYIGKESGSSGVVNVVGTDATWAIGQSLLIGTNGARAGGVATLTVEDGALLVVGDRLHLGEDASVAIDSASRAVIGSGTDDGNRGILDVRADGQLLGSGTIVASVENGGVVSPGEAIGALNVRGDYVQHGGALIVEIGGPDNSDPESPQFDVLQATDLITLGGTLDVRLVDLGTGRYRPSPGDRFEIVTTTDGRIDGRFTSMKLPPLPDRLKWVIDQNSNAVVLDVWERLIGDLNSDGVVNGLDVGPFVDTTLNGTYLPEADFNDDKVINGLDIDLFVAAMVGGRTAKIPEPSTQWLSLLALALVTAARSKKS